MTNRLTDPQMHLLRRLDEKEPTVVAPECAEALSGLLLRGLVRCAPEGVYRVEAGSRRVRDADRSARSHRRSKEPREAKALVREPVLVVTVTAKDPTARQAMVRYLAKHLREVMHLETPYEVR